MRLPRLIEYLLSKTAIADSFKAEARVYTAIAKKPHPHLVSRRGCLLQKGHVVGLLLQKYKYTLLEAVSKEPKIDIAEIFSQAAAAARHLHSLGFCHNDIHVNNIILSDARVAVLIDF